MATNYPTSIDTYATLPLVQDLVSAVQADDVNRLRDAIVAIETELGVNPSGTYGTLKDRLDALTALVEALSGGGVIDITADFISGHIETPDDKTYYLVNDVPYAGYIDSVTTQATSGTCTATVEINGTPLGGTANSVSSSEQTQSHVSSNTFVASDVITLVVSSNASTADMRFTLNIVRTT